MISLVFTSILTRNPRDTSKNALNLNTFNTTWIFLLTSPLFEVSSVVINVLIKARKCNVILCAWKYAITVYSWISVLIYSVKPSVTSKLAWCSKKCKGLNKLTYFNLKSPQTRLSPCAMLFDTPTTFFFIFNKHNIKLHHSNLNAWAPNRRL